MAAFAVRRAGPGEGDWAAVLGLIRGAFAYMEGRIDPPSSMHRLTVGEVAETAASGAVFLAEAEGALLGCVFCRPRPDALYVGKLAVRPDRRGCGIGRALMAAAEAEARARGLPALEVQTRIELTENHATFAALGFVRSGETAHPGFDRPTSVTMRRGL